MKKILCVFVTLICLTNLWSLDLEKTYGIFKIEIHEKPGTFSVFVTDGETGNSVPVLSTVNSSSGTRFFLQMDTNVYPLTYQSGVTVEQFLTAVDARFEYTLKDKFKVELILAFFSSTPNSLQDIMRVSFNVLNVDKTSHNFALKTVFDTCLGESTLRHFSTKKQISVNKEMVFVSMAEDKWIRSSNDINSVQFLLDGADITQPLQVVLANRDLLLSKKWIPSFKNGRGFNSIFSYDNSALCIYWKPEFLESNQSLDSRFYITAGTYSQNPSDISSSYFAAFVPKSELEQQDTVVSQNSNSKNIEKPKDSVIDIVDEQLDPVYIQALLDRIAELEKDSSSVKQEEIDMLNAELDLILDGIRN